MEVPSGVSRQSGPVALAGVSDGEHCLAGGGAAGQPRPGSVVVTVTACGTARGQYTDRKNRVFYYKTYDSETYDSELNFLNHTDQNLRGGFLPQGLGVLLWGWGKTPDF